MKEKEEAEVACSAVREELAEELKRNARLQEEIDSKKRAMVEMEHQLQKVIN